MPLVYFSCKPEAPLAMQRAYGMIAHDAQRHDTLALARPHGPTSIQSALLINCITTTAGTIIRYTTFRALVQITIDLQPGTSHHHRKNLAVATFSNDTGS